MITCYSDLSKGFGHETDQQLRNFERGINHKSTPEPRQVGKYILSRLSKWIKVGHDGKSMSVIDGSNDKLQKLDFTNSFSHLLRLQVFRIYIFPVPHLSFYTILSIISVTGCLGTSRTTLPIIPWPRFGSTFD